MTKNILLAFFCICAGAFVPRQITAQPSLVVLVRHGEKQPAPADDPSLSDAGVARAHALDKALALSAPDTIDSPAPPAR